MPTPGEIRRKAAGVGQAADEIRREKDKYQGIANSAGTWWQGEAGRVFKEEYEEINSDISRLISKMGNLESGLNRMASEVQRADEERRRKALEEQKRRAAAAAAAVTAKK